MRVLSTYAGMSSGAVGCSVAPAPPPTPTPGEEALGDVLAPGDDVRSDVAGRADVDVVGLAGGGGELVFARPKRDAKGLERRGPVPLPDGEGKVCLPPGRGGSGGPLTLAAGRGGSGRLLVCAWTANEGYGGALRE